MRTHICYYYKWRNQPMTTLMLDASAKLERQLPPTTFPTLDLADAVAQAKIWGAAVRTTLQKAREEKAAVTVRSLAQASDLELVAAIAMGEEAALECLYERYARPAYAVAYRLLRDVQAAEDIVQDAFLAIWRKAGTYQAQHGSVYSWLQAIVHHRAIDRLRAAANREQLCSPLDADIEQHPLCAEPDAYNQVWHGEQRRLV